MGKRTPKGSEHPHRELDYYPTPYKAVLPLIPHLRGVRTFAEPCEGPERALVGHLESFGLRCVSHGDIATGQDALTLTVADINGADAIITNPPFLDPVTGDKTGLIRKLIARFQSIAPRTWLLLPLDWTATEKAVPYLKTCSDIVNIGRVKWMSGTKSHGMDNFAWARFAASHVGGPVLHPWKAAPPDVRPLRCAQCSKPYAASRSDSRFCSDTCRQRAHRDRLAVTKL
jgi:hypothetical protein